MGPMRRKSAEVKDYRKVRYERECWYTVLYGLEHEHYIDVKDSPVGTGRKSVEHFNQILKSLTSPDSRCSRDHLDDKHIMNC